MSYHVDRFYAAVSVLAGHGHIKQRLIKAYEDNLSSISDDELPLEIKKTFSALRAHMHRVAPLNGEGPICASVRKMSIDEAADCAGSVVAMYGHICRLEPHAESMLPIDATERPGVPPFLVKTN